MKKIGYNNWLISQQKEHKLERHKKVTLFRRYWDSGNKEYTWEKTISKEIDQDIIKCGKVTWKADADLLNQWKMGNVTLTADNTHGKWDVDNTSGYFYNYVPFLSMIRIEVGFVAEDGSIYEIFTYQGLITKDGIQLDNEKQIAKIKVIALDYLIQVVDAEEVSKRPIYPELKYYNSDIVSTTTIGKTGSAWTVNAYQYLIVRIIGGTGNGQERAIQSNTADTLTVNTWQTTPDATSDFEILGEYMGVGNGSQTAWTTVQPGVGKIVRAWITDDYKYQGENYDVTNLNSTTLGATLTFKSPVGSGERVICDYIYWYQAQTFKFLIEKILDLANITNRFVQDVTFPEQLGVGVEVTWTQTSQVDWQAGINTQGNLTNSPGDIMIDDDRSIYRQDYGADETSTSFGRIITGSQIAAMIITPTKTAYLDHVNIRLTCNGSPDGWLRVELRTYTGAGNDPGSVIMQNTNILSPGSGSQIWRTAEFGSNNYKLVSGTKYWITMYRYSYSIGDVYVRLGTNGLSWRYYAEYNGVIWDHFFENYNWELNVFYNPYYGWGSHMSQTHDAGTSLTNYGKIVTTETLNTGTVTYYTRTQDADVSWPTVWSVADWDPVDAFDNITSPVRRYIRVAAYYVPGYDGRTWASGDLNTPYIYEYQIKYNTTKYEPSLANFTDKNGKSAIEVMAKLANYEMGFFTDFDDSLNMTWDVTYDGSVMPNTVGWIENKTGDGAGSISSGELFINGTSGHCFYDRTVSGLDSRVGWTVEANIEKTVGSDENFEIIINDGTFSTRVAITNQGYLKLKQYNKDDLTQTKKATLAAGSRQNIKIARKGEVVKIYVNNEVVLMSFVNAPAYTKKIFFGQYGDTSATYQAVINWLRYSASIPCFETFYLPKYYFQDRNSIIDSTLKLKADENYVKVYNFKYGWDRIFNYVKADYGNYSSYANGYTELDESPNSEDTYGKKLLSISGENFLKAEDTNVAVGTAKRYYAFYKLPRKRFKLLCRYLFQINLANKVYVYSDFPLTLTNLPCKVVGIVLNIDNFTLDLDVEEII